MPPCDPLSFLLPTLPRSSLASSAHQVPFLTVAAQCCLYGSVYPTSVALYGCTRRRRRRTNTFTDRGDASKKHATGCASTFSASGGRFLAPEPSTKTAREGQIGPREVVETSRGRHCEQIATSGQRFRGSRLKGLGSKAPGRLRRPSSPRPGAARETGQFGSREGSGGRF